MPKPPSHPEEAYVLATADDSQFLRVVEQITALHFNVRRFSDTDSFQEALGEVSKATLFAIDGSLLGENEAREVFSELKIGHPTTPVIWLCASGTLAPNHLALLPEVILESEEHIDTMVQKTQALLVDHFFPRIDNWFCTCREKY